MADDRGVSKTSQEGDGSKDEPEEEKVPKDKIIVLQGLELWGKIASGDIHTVSREEVDELFQVLDTKGKGKISANDVMTLQYVETLKLSEAELLSLSRESDKFKTGWITSEGLFKALTNGTVAFNLIRESLGKREKESKNTECDRQILLDWMNMEYETSTALWSLPLVIATFISFVLFSTTHVDVWNGWEIAQTLKLNLPNIYARPYPGPKVHDVPTLMTFLSTRYMPAYFKQDLNKDPIVGRVQTYNQIIGGVRMVKKVYETGDCPVSKPYGKLYDQLTPGSCHRQGEAQFEHTTFPYHLKYSKISERFQNLTKPLWLFDKRTTSLEAQTLFYNAHANVFTIERNQWNLQPDGFIRLRQFHEHIIADPYSNPLSYVPDALFLATMIRTMHLISNEFLPALAAGKEGLKDYFFKFWTLVDWLIVVGGGVALFSWSLVVNQVSVILPGTMENIEKRKLDARVYAQKDFLDPDDISKVIPGNLLELEIDKVLDAALQLETTHVIFRMICFFYLFILMMKFFKAFRANGRLDVVVKTLKACANNVAHFFIVFGSLFSCFAFAGHLLIGHKSLLYSTLHGSLLGSWISLGTSMDELDELDYTTQAMGYAWTLSFQFLVKMLVLNMLMGIVFEAYGSCKSKAGEPETIWAQIRRAIRTSSETRSYIPLYLLIVAFEDDDFPAHPQTTVTARSLKRAFDTKKMTRANAEYLVKKAVEYKKDMNICDTDLNLADATRVIGQVKTCSLQNLSAAEECLEIYRTTVQEADAVRNQLERQVNAAKSVSATDATKADPKAKAAPKALAGPNGTAVGPNGTVVVADPKAKAAPKAAPAAVVATKPKTAYERAMEAQKEAEKIMAFKPQTAKDVSASLIDMAISVEDARTQQGELAMRIEQALRKEWDTDNQQAKWFEEELQSLEARMNRTERSVGRLGASFSGTKFRELSGVPSRIEEEVMPYIEREQGESGLIRLKRLVDRMGLQVDDLHRYADDGTAARHSLWQIELNLRKHRKGKSTVPLSTFNPIKGAASSKESKPSSPKRRAAPVLDGSP
eukprot:TRINITY_DN5478_c0_g1_i1.p1 TRINITY_DN5478_c0_g1~~TRINITY_DN5478_c0_g1_i1.p1  ORF type:complete len:1043 (+),score=157.89 TRINITY_DN5478_c0_g1_i1:55-3183(+)